MYIGIPQILVLLNLMLGLGIALARDGEARSSKHSAVITLCDVVITIAVLYWGGFFS